MGDNSKISWTDASWNPVTGCSRVSEGCRNCYAEALSLRMKWTKKPWTKGNAGENIKLHPERLDQPIRWKRARRVFVNSMSDLFAAEVPDVFIAQVFAAMAASPQHTFQVLTKRPERMAALIGQGDGWEDLLEKACDDLAGMMGWCHVGEDRHGVWPLPNVWLGTSVEDQRAANERIPSLLKTPAAVRFLSCEPLLGPIDLRLDLIEENEGSGFLHHVKCPNFCEYSCGGQGIAGGLHWVITGGESGKNFRPMDPDWACSIKEQCLAHGVAFFHKQSSAFRSEQEPWITEPDGSRWIWHQYPGDLAAPQRVEGR